ncbi:MAG: bifunctional folylpolyglutamate synthase/dihydrofolate synthase [Clostridiales bacterium]|nr:bifunctional folylpolyglutamate synthase/dihydrofolate synthase [Clostridiales bacterium]MCF8022272.1 bifunctional folylpolyglutamate synthase/dihydrofolate synthase [Clostridiales bacterium]
MTFEESLNYLQNLTKFGMNFGLGRIAELMRCLGNPEKNLNVIHLGGTNGKGSTGAMIVSVLQDAGYNAGIFTSPHLHSYTERYRVNNKNIEPEDMARLIEKMRPHLDAMVEQGFEHPTEFEVCTAIAFCYFHEKNVDFLVLEVGLGGEIDSTNIIEKPLVSVITNVAMDHMDYLGKTREEIARVKSGIVKEGRFVVTASGHQGVLGVIKETCARNSAPLVHVGADITWERVGEISTRGQYLNVKGRRDEYTSLWIPFMGLHQLENTSTAVAVLEVIQEKGYQLTGKNIKNGLSCTCWPARLEIVQEKPLILIDAAHNYDGAKSLRSALDEYFPQRRVVLVMGMLGDKERARVVAELAPRACAAIITRPNSPRAGDWHELAGEIEPWVAGVEVIEDIEKAVYRGISMAGDEDIVCITGSFYMVAEAREYLVEDLKW